MFVCSYFCSPDLRFSESDFYFQKFGTSDLQFRKIGKVGISDYQQNQIPIEE
jgi:hypothetical protein